MEELCVWKFVCSSLLCVGVEVCALKFVKEMWVTKLRVKELCSSLCERVVCVCAVYESVVCGIVYVFQFACERIMFKRDVCSRLCVKELCVCETSEEM